MADSIYRVDLSCVTPINKTLKGIPLSEAPDGLFQQMIEAKKFMLESDYTELPDTANNPTYKYYASIVANGKIVAHLDNHGWLITSNAKADAFTQAVNKADAKAGAKSGPLLAQARAEEIAASINGVIVKEPTAMTQRDYNAIPQPQARIDTKAMMKDPRFAELELLRQTHTAFLTQQLAQNDGKSETIQTLG